MRESGFYWVVWKGFINPEVAEWKYGFWYATGSDGEYRDTSISKVISFIPYPKSGEESEPEPEGTPS